MAHDRIHLRYQIKDNLNDDYWCSVIDIFSGQPAVIRGVVIDRLTAEEADDMVDLLNRQALDRVS